MYDGIITNCDSLLIGLLQSAMDSYYKLRQVLQSAIIITNCDSTTVLARKLHNAPDRGRGGSCVVITGRAPA